MRRMSRFHSSVEDAGHFCYAKLESSLPQLLRSELSSLQGIIWSHADGDLAGLLRPER